MHCADAADRKFMGNLLNIPLVVFVGHAWTGEWFWGLVAGYLLTAWLAQRDTPSPAAWRWFVARAAGLVFVMMWAVELLSNWSHYVAGVVAGFAAAAG
jgi:hypothetical protein